jgi:hypothetical protein
MPSITGCWGNNSPEDEMNGEYDGSNYYPHSKKPSKKKVSKKKVVKKKKSNKIKYAVDPWPEIPKLTLKEEYEQLSTEDKEFVDQLCAVMRKYKDIGPMKMLNCLKKALDLV